MLLQMKQRRCPSPIVSFMVSLAGALFFVLPVGVDLSVVDVLCLLSGALPRLGCFLSKWACFLGVFYPLKRQSLCVWFTWVPLSMHCVRLHCSLAGMLFNFIFLCSPRSFEGLSLFNAERFPLRLRFFGSLFLFSVRAINIAFISRMCKI